MHIFARKKKTEIPELTLVQMQESIKYNVWAALAKAVLIFLLIYGAMGGFLSAFEIEYNNGLCMLVLFGMALVLSAVYETEKRWLTNLVSILLFALYLYIAVSNYWTINSGYYAVLNKAYETARDYLSVDSGMEYSLVVEETYTTVTMFAMFLGMVGVILLNIMLQSRYSLFKVVALTLVPYIIPFYFECSPDLIYILMLLTGYLAVMIVQGGNVRSGMSAQMCYVLPLAAVLTILTVRILSFVLPEARYENITPKNTLKASSEAEMTRFAQYGMYALLSRGSAGAGVSGGRLNRGSAIVPSYETVLKVRYTPYDLSTVYLKAFTGKDYFGDLWTPATEYDDIEMFTSLVGRMENYYGVDGQHERGSLQGRGIMEVEKQDDDDQFEYQPYYTDSGWTERQGNMSTYVYYPAVSEPGEVSDTVSDAFLVVPDSCREAVMTVCDDAGFAGTAEEIAEQVVRYFDDNYSYTLRPGYYYGNPDYISHFLLENKRGYCSHFASAGTMLLRQMGIPARYVEGYAFSYYNVIESGELVEDAEYSDYYDGYAPIGETALIELEIPDAYAHAWVEIYVDGKGWIVVDPTPAQTSEEDAGAFWDTFMNGGGTGTSSEMTESNLGEYLEGALSGMVYVLLGAAALLLIGWCIAYLLRVYRESKLSKRERVRLEYGRIQSRLSRKHQDYRKLRTLKEQLDWMRGHGRLSIDEEKEKSLYQVYFADHVNCDCEELRRQLRKIYLAICCGIY